MDFLNSNFFNTTTQLTIASGTLTGTFLLNRDLRRQYVTDGFGNDLTTASLTISFDATTAISRIALMGMNLKGFDVFVNGTTASTLTLTSTADTTVSQFSTNSETSIYLEFTQVDATSVTIDMKTTALADSEKAIGWFLVSVPLISFDRIPSAPNYKPLINQKEVVHKMSDGGIRVQTIAEKQSAAIKFKFITESFRDSLKSVYDLHDNFVFVAFPTTSNWDEIIFESVWPGKFDFFKFSDNARGAGFSGNIRLNEISN